MRVHEVTVHPSASRLPRHEQLAWKLAAMAADPVEVEPDVEAMILNRILDNIGVGIAAINRRPVVTARAMALRHPRPGGATVLGVPSGQCVTPEWAAWANNTAVRELDMHDTFLAEDFAHPGDNIPPILAVAQAANKTGKDLIRAIATAYEVQMSLVRGISLHKHKIDHIAHLCPAQAAGIGTLLGLPVETIYQAIQHAVHVSFTTRQSRKSEISSWKAFAPAHAGKLAVEAVDRAIRGEDSPSPIYEGEDSVIAWMLDGPAACYHIQLLQSGEAKRSILQSFTKEHSAEYQAQAFIDLAFRLRSRIADLGQIERIVLHSSHHTHFVIGTGANDPQKFDPDASRETLDHSLPYIFAVALEDGRWHHEESYAPERRHRASTLRLWHSISTLEDPEWSRRYHTSNPQEKAFGGKAQIFLRDSNGASTVFEDELAVANAHPLGAAPFARDQYRHKFEVLTREFLTASESQRFMQAVDEAPDLPAGQLDRLNAAVPAGMLLEGAPGMF